MAIDYDRINWENGKTPLNADNLNKTDKALDEVITQVNKQGIYTVYSSSWNETDNVVYPFINKIYAPSVFADDDTPIAQLWGMDDIETTEEIDAISKVTKVIVDSRYITLYATSKPTVNLKLVLKG